MVTPVCITWAALCSLSREEQDKFELLSDFDFLTIMRICLRVVKNSSYFSIVNHFMAFDFSVVSLYSFKEICILLESLFHTLKYLYHMIK